MDEWRNEKYKVLIVEDQDEIGQLMASWFEAAGYIAVRATNGEEGVRVFKEERPDVVITDLIMPVMGGLEFCRRVREELEVPIMVLSALPEEDARTDRLEAGASAFAVKPTAMGDLMEWVRRYSRALRAGPASVQMSAQAEQDHGMELLADKTGLVRPGSDVKEPNAFWTSFKPILRVTLDIEHGARAMAAALKNQRSLEDIQNLILSV